MAFISYHFAACRDEGESENLNSRKNSIFTFSRGTFITYFPATKVSINLKSE